MLLDQCTNLDDFLLAYGKQLAAQARERLSPLHCPGRDTVQHDCHGSKLVGAGTMVLPDSARDVVLPHLLRKPFDPQAHVMAAILKGFKKNKSIQLVAEMGTGKTLMSEGAAHAHCLAKNANHWHALNGKCWAIRHGSAPDPTEVIKQAHGEVIDVGPLKMMNDIWPTFGTDRTFNYAGRKFKVEGVDNKGGRSIGRSPVYDVVASCRSAGMKPDAKPVAFRCTCRGAYRVLVVCPTVLLAKWERELIETVPHAVVFRIKNYRDLLGMAGQYREDRGRFEPHWARPQDEDGTRGAGVRVDSLAARNERLEGEHRVRRGDVRTYPIGYEFYLIGREMMKLSGSWKHSFGNRWMVNEGGRGKRIGNAGFDGLPCCPSCKGLIRTKKTGDPEDETYFKDARRNCQCKVKNPDGVTFRDCGERMWQETGKPARRYAPSRTIQKRMKGYFDVSIFDEAHEYKSDNSLQADAVGGIAASSKKCMALTGTLVGGYAWHLRSLLFRLKIAQTLITEGLEWKKVTEFNKRYGRIFTRETIYPSGEESGRAYGRNKKRAVHQKPAPGIVYSVFKHIIHNSIFLSLKEVAANLPDLDERVIRVDMEPALAQAYGRVEREITRHVKEKLLTGSRKALGMMVQTLLLYPDHPFGWENGVGYRERSRVTKQMEWVTVCYPHNLERNPQILRNKEMACLEWTKGQVKKGHQVWLYCTYVGKKNTMNPLAVRLRAAGLRVAEMYSGEVEPIKREAWISEHGPKHDVIMSNPEAVKTGLDFFDKKPGGHNYSSIGFYQTGYSIFTLRQASRRAWRIGQKRPCETAYFFYTGTMQERAMGLMGKKIKAAQQLEGDFSCEGLAAEAGDEGDMEAALARSLIAAADESGGCRAWDKVTQAGVVEDRKAVNVDEALAEIEAMMREMGLATE